MSRNQLLEAVKIAREKRVNTPKLDAFEHVMAIPEIDYYALLKVFPLLNSQNHKEKQAEWERFFASEYSFPYRVARTPQQVQRYR